MYPKKELAKKTLPDVKLKLENARIEYMRAEKEIIVGKYNLPEKPSSDGYYRLYVADRNSKTGRRHLSAKSIEELADKVYQHEKGIDGPIRKTFAEVFELFIEKKLRRVKDPEKKSSVQNTINKYRGDYNRYFRGSQFEKKYIDEISKKDIENTIEQILTKYDLTKKAFSNMLTILRSVFHLAFCEYWIEEDVFLRIEPKDFWGMLHEPIPSSERAYSEDELIAIIKAIRDYQANNPEYMPAFALELQILIGSRISEPAPLKWSYIDEDYIYLTQAQFVVKKTDTEKQHLQIVNHTKNKKDRRFPRTDAINEFLERLAQVHKTYNLNSDYLFPAKSSTGVVTYDSVYSFYRRTITSLGIKKPGMIMGPHSFRRNAVTDTVNATNGNFKLASLIYGNSAKVAKNNYFIGYDKQIALDALNKRKFVV